MSSRSWHTKIFENEKEEKNEKKYFQINDFFLPGIIFLLIIIFLWILQPQFVKVDEETSWIRIILVAAICAILFWLITDYIQ